MARAVSRVVFLMYGCLVADYRYKQKPHPDDGLGAASVVIVLFGLVTCRSSGHS